MYPVLGVLTLSPWSSLRSEAPHKTVIQNMKNLVLLNSTFPRSCLGSACCASAIFILKGRTVFMEISYHAAENTEVF